MKEGWTYKKLGEVCYKITDGSHNPPKGIEHSDNVMLSSQNVQNGFLDMSAVRYLSDADFEIENKRTNASKGDVLLTIVGTIGRTCVLKGNEGNITFQRSVAILKPKEEIMSRYLMFFLMSCNSKLNSTAQGAAQKGIYLKQLGNITLHYPSIDEQQRIVERLDSAFENIDKLKANAEKQLSEARILFQKSLAKAMEPKEGWEEKTLGEIAVDMYRGAGIKRDQVTEEGIPCVRYGEIYTTYNVGFNECVSHTKIEYLKSPKYFEHGDLLFAITGESVEDIGKTIAYLGKEKCLLGGDIICMKHKQNPKYLAYALSTPDAIKQKGFGKTKLKVVHTNAPALKAIKIPLPPLPVQQRIVERLDSLSENVRKYEEIQRQIISECDALKQALLRKVFE